MHYIRCHRNNTGEVVESSGKNVHQSLATLTNGRGVFPLMSGNDKDTCYLNVKKKINVLQNDQIKLNQNPPDGIPN